MDTDSLSFGYEEHFPVFESSDFLNIEDESESMEGAFGTSDRNLWEWEVERELNGDVALIPMSSEVGMNFLSNSPPMREDYQKIMSEWQNFMNIEVPGIEEFDTDVPLSAEEENTIYIADTAPNPYVSTLDMPISLPLSLNFEDCTDYMEQKTTVKASRPSGKKIDMNAQCYIVEENGKLPKLELTDADTDTDSDKDDDDDTSDDDNKDYKADIKPKIEEIDICNEDIDDIHPPLQSQPLEQPDQELQVNSYKDADLENDYVDVDTIPKHDTPILQAGDLNSLLEQFEATETTKYFEPAAQPPIDEELFELQTSKQSPVHVASEPTNSQVSAPIQNDADSPPESDKNKQILDALPQELIMRIKASSKRKVIPVIDAIPSKRRGIKKPQVEVVQTPPEKVEKRVNPEFVQLDHDYCSLLTPYPKHPKKDSGFESAEEDEQRNILRNQPTVKGANGKLMVSLLKVNTIKNSIISENNKKKRKLNLEEYKKRREGVIRSCDNSQSNSPVNSGRNSPAVIEDENMRLLKHQQKLIQMAADVLKTPPKSARKSVLPAPEEFVPPAVPQEEFTVPPPPRIPPNNVEVKVLVSIGVNTDFADLGDAASKQFDVPVTELEEIKPLLQNANAKISNNSLITSVIENIQNKKKNIDTSASAHDKSNKQSKEQQHGEDKTIVYLDKGRPFVVTNSVEVQTDVVETETRRCKRRRSSSSSSSSNDHRKSCKRRSSSKDSHHSYTSQSSSSSTSRSRSRSSSPQRIYNRKRAGPIVERERVREVEERRIVYVGGISPTMTKEALRRRFQQYGPISNISVHFREYGDNYGFVTFAYKVDAYEAVEHGNDDPSVPRYDLSFGGRRIFCRTHYADLDSVQDEMDYSAAQVEDSFDNLLREAQAKLRKRKSYT